MQCMVGCLGTKMQQYKYSDCTVVSITPNNAHQTCINVAVKSTKYI